MTDDRTWDKPRVVVYVEGGVIQGARATHDVLLEVLDRDNYQDMSKDEQEAFDSQEAAYDHLPFAIF